MLLGDLLSLLSALVSKRYRQELTKLYCVVPTLRELPISPRVGKTLGRRGKETYRGLRLLRILPSHGPWVGAQTILLSMPA